ncbi:hypothetical protein [Peredibacter starrii]|uniref:Uncharacterized protein n=1 Tax=Peredibacter starrii TaxID=28202 RepID=A0AAX4HQX5_9BACT|nr:hypothetical protein [Peredibacter starrii]WPU65460.1 hypothetical protein SOO65_01740 [Peredibacter starrii]
MKNLLRTLPLLVLSAVAHAAYEDHFPAYFEYCTGTQWKLQNGEKGGIPGHGFTYIHGLCKDYRSTYPQVIPCSEVSAELKEKYPHEGVGVSLDKNFSNVMWVAIPGRNLTLFGDIERKAISNDDVKNIIQKVTELKVFQDVVHKGERAQSLPFNSQEYLEEVADATLGTEYAVSWARELHCTRIPAPVESLPAVAKFLNEANNQYKDGPGYEWSKVSNNCAHLAINTSNAMGINKSIKLDQGGIKKLFSMALPANTFLMYADQTALKKKPSLRKLSKTLNEKTFSPVQVGSLIANYPAFPSGEKFNTDDLKVLTAPRPKSPLKLLSTPEKYEKKHMTPENSELKANAEMWQAHYLKLINQLDIDQKGSVLEQYLQEQLELTKSIILAP